MRDQYQELKCSRPDYRISVVVLLILMVCGYAAARYIGHHGHWVTGMNNQIVWGLPHVFAILLILAASGVLHIASISSVFGQQAYAPWARLSALLSICLLLGGLVVLVLDLGRPERLMVAMTHYNFKSVFAWNIFLYSGFVVVVIACLYTMFEPGMNNHIGKAGLIVFIWRLVLTSATGSIFGFLVARQFYGAAMMVPIFIVLSLVLGTAVFILLGRIVSLWGGNPIEDRLLVRLGKWMAAFVALELLLVTVFHLTNLYMAEHHGVEKFILRHGGIHTVLFWFGQILTGAIAPLVMIYLTRLGDALKGVMAASVLTIAGAIAQLYVTIIGGQAWPLELFPGKNVSSSFYDGVVASYAPSLAEFMLGVGGLALALLLIIGAMRVLPFLPDNRIHKTG